MASESSSNDPGTPTHKHPTASPPPPPKPHLPNGDSAPTNQPAPQGPQGQPFPFFPGQDAAPNGDPHHAAPTEPGGNMNVQVPYPPGMPLYQFGSSMPGPPPMTRPKRTQCKNACTNCQKACKKCDDNRPCHRCIRYGTTDSCVDSKRKERKKGVKRGPYKKRDSKGHSADADDEGSGVGPAGVHGPSPNMPYVGPVGYPPGMWSSYPGGPGTKIEGGGYYQPVFALTPVSGQPPHGDGENANGGGDGAPHFPVGFYPATFISYPGPYPPPYPIPHGQGTPPQGYHYAFPPPPGMYPHRPPIGSGTPNGEQSAAGPSGSGEPQTKDAPDIVEEDKGGEKEAASEPQVNGKAKAVTADTQVNGTTPKEAD